MGKVRAATVVGPFNSVPTKVRFFPFVTACRNSSMRYPPKGDVQQPSVIESPSGNTVQAAPAVVGQGMYAVPPSDIPSRAPSATPPSDGDAPPVPVDSPPAPPVPTRPPVPT